FRDFCSKDISDVALQLPYPFAAPRSALESEFASVGDFSDWQIQWNWDGIRVQLIKREGVTSIWSDQNQILNDCFPELLEEAKSLRDGVVLEGFVLAWKDADVLPYHYLEQRLGRKGATRKVQEEVPVIFMAIDILEESSEDIRSECLELRRQRLSDVLSSRGKMKSDDEFEQLKLFAPCQAQLSTVLRLSPTLSANNLQELRELFISAAQLKMTGLLLNHKLSSYGSKSSSLESLIWNLDPLKINAVLYSARPTPGRRTGLFNEYTVAVWHGDELLSLARINSGLGEEDALFVDAFVRENTIEKYGPVRVVKPELVFEVLIERIQKSTKHKSGVVARGATILALKKDADIRQVHSLESILSKL
ncbi:MAG: hypothetical protein K2X81_03135, partial [Candidatus Obscuribacterales bacterium]|nr:hypothetical protein [Candidatus Obscuribacterales bacterium]